MNLTHARRCYNPQPVGELRIKPGFRVLCKSNSVQSQRSHEWRLCGMRLQHRDPVLIVRNGPFMILTKRRRSAPTPLPPTRLRGSSVDPDDPSIDDNIACAMALLGETDAALDTLETCLPRVDPVTFSVWVEQDNGPQRTPICCQANGSFELKTDF
ncbi:hypothetical protein RXV90_21260 [Rhodophyticola sp. MJ-SS7]|nr:hypothetical protein [Rhodophyticola sp. MJ-SS7]